MLWTPIFTNLNQHVLLMLQTNLDCLTAGSSEDFWSFSHLSLCETLDPMCTEPMGPYLYKLEISCPTDVSDKSWLPYYNWFFRRKFLSLFPLRPACNFGPHMPKINGSLDFHLIKFETYHYLLMFQTNHNCLAITGSSSEDFKRFSY